MRSHLYFNWVFWATLNRDNGYYVIDSYPYVVYNGYRHRYSSFDTCNYQLVDKYTQKVVKSWWNYTCNTAYDLCASKRTSMNYRFSDYRFFCAETFRDQNYRFNTYSSHDDYPSYNDNNNYYYDSEYDDYYDYEYEDEEYYGDY